MTKKGAVASGILPYLYDVAFQKYVVTKALEELYPNEKFTVKARLMMADKSKEATVDGLNQMFRICKKGDRSFAVADSKAWTVAAAGKGRIHGEHHQGWSESNGRPGRTGS